MEVGGEEIIYPSLHCHHQDDSRIKMGNDESCFNVTLIVRDKVTRQCPHATTFEEKGESPRHCTVTSVLRNCCFYCCAGKVTKTMSVALLFRNN